MGTAIDPRIAEMLCSRLCHDLVSPVGAIKSGLEFIAEFGGEPDDEAMGLINNSAEQAVAKLKFFRVAYGLVGAAQAVMPLSAAAEVATIVVGGGRTALDWPTSQRPERPVLRAESLKLLLNMILLGAEALPRGGSLRVRLTSEGRGMEARIVAAGEGAGLKADLADAFQRTSGVEDLTVRTVQGYYTALLGRRLGTPVRIEHEVDPQLVCSLPVVSGA